MEYSLQFTVFGLKLSFQFIFKTILYNYKLEYPVNTNDTTIVISEVLIKLNFVHIDYIKHFYPQIRQAKIRHLYLINVITQ